jgi:acyl carrier protein
MQDHGAADMPIGRPIANVSAYVLDAGLEPVPAGSLGELYIGGAAVGLGYLNRPALNAERFLANPHGPGRLFRTGDRAVRTGDGVLRFFGRSDNQVKVRGFRIELGEIEAMLLRNPTVAEAVAAVQEHDAGDRRLVAFVRLKSNQLASSAELLAWLRTQLPPHMIPGAIGIRTSLPRTAHGKLDRAALASQRIEALPRALPLPAARSARDAAFCNCFAAVLGVDDIDPDEDFFALGGHSLLAVELQAVLSDALGHEVSIVDIFEYPTARRLSQALYAKIENGDRPILRSSADIGGTAS